MSPLISMATSKIQSTHSPFCEHRFQETITTSCSEDLICDFCQTISSPRKRNGVIKVLSKPNVKKANLSAARKERIKIPNYSDIAGNENSIYHISEFFSHPSGVEAILNLKALQSFQSLDSNLYRCILPQVKLLTFEVAPVIDLQVTPTAQDCLVEMISCKFEGNDAVERQNEHFSASMRNHIRWETIASEQFLDVDVELNLVLEIYTQPFAMLPSSTVEGPGNIMMQALVDQLVPLLLQQLVQDYEDWVLNQQSKHHLQ